MTSLYKTTFTTQYGKAHIVPVPVTLTIKVVRDEDNACFVSVLYHAKGTNHRTIKSYPEAIATDIAKKSAAIAKKDDYPVDDKYGNRVYKKYNPSLNIPL